LHELHDDENVAQGVGALRSHDIEDLGGEAVVLHLSELPQDLDLTHNFLGVVLALENVANEFDCDLLSRISMFGLNDLAVAALTNELDELVVFKGVSPNWC